MHYETNLNFKTKEFERIEFNDRNQLVRNITSIAVVLKNSKDDSFLLEPIVNSYLKEKFWFNNASLNTQKKNASVICEFMNFCRFNLHAGNVEFVELKQGFRNLKFKHGSLFLKEQLEKYYRGEIKVNTVLEKQFPLLRFYNYLLTVGIIEEEVDKLIQLDEKKKETLIHNPFTAFGEYAISFPKKEHIFQPVRDLTNHSHQRRIELIHLLIRLAEQKFPDISLLICFMMYGGIRIGETVNITRKNLELPKFYDDTDFGNNGFTIQIVDNPQLFLDSKSLSSNQVKRKVPYARLIMNDITFVSKIYMNHKKRLLNMEKSNFIKNKNAFFVCSYNGKPLKKQTAANQFRKLIKLFIDELVLAGDIETLEVLTDSNTGKIKFSPHLCRAIFTNMLIDLGYSKMDIVNFRGDLTEDAVDKYWNWKKIKKKREDTVEELQIRSLENLNL